jgi:hypothetical protein
LTFLALVTLVAKAVVGVRNQKEREILPIAHESEIAR